MNRIRNKNLKFTIRKGSNSSRFSRLLIIGSLIRLAEGKETNCIIVTLWKTMSNLLVSDPKKLSIFAAFIFFCLSLLLSQIAQKMINLRFTQAKCIKCQLRHVRRLPQGFKKSFVLSRVLRSICHLIVVSNFAVFLLSQQRNHNSRQKRHNKHKMCEKKRKTKAELIQWVEQTAE